MAEIEICCDKKCDMREDCYRYTAKPDKYMQSYFPVTPRRGKKCKYFVPNNPKDG